MSVQNKVLQELVKIKIRKAEIMSEVREKEKDVKGVTERQCRVQKMFAMSV